LHTSTDPCRLLNRRPIKAEDRATQKNRNLGLTGGENRSTKQNRAGRKQVTRNTRSPDAFSALARRTRIRDVAYLRAGNKISNGGRHEGRHEKQSSRMNWPAHARERERESRPARSAGRKQKDQARKTGLWRQDRCSSCALQWEKEIGRGGTGSRARSCADGKSRTEREKN
jgi:hypothetical protein